MPDEVPPPSVHYGFERIGDRITFARARPTSGALSNAGIVDLGGFTLLFDTSLLPSAARDLRAASLARTGRPPSMAVNSHWHLDHILGNQVLDGVPILASRRTLQILRERQGELRREISPEKLAEDVRGLEDGLRSATTPVARAAFEAALRINRPLLAEAGELRWTLPTDGFDGVVFLPGKRHAKLWSPGSGHTESDALLFLPDDGVLFAGDLVVAGQHPNLTSGDPEHWREVLEGIERLHPERIVPGHGPMADLATVAEVGEYLAALLELGETDGPAEIPSRFATWDGPEQFEENLAYLRARRRRTAAVPPADP